jgi:cytochrome b subunit of formate dehydrogenase
MSAASSPERIERFCKTTRWFHWTFALSFLSLAASGALLLFREDLGLSEGAVHGLIETHEITAVIFLSVPWLIGLSGDTRRWLMDLSECTRLSGSDWLWLRRRPRAFITGEPLPPQQKLNAGQKLNAIAVATLSALLIASGLHLWAQPGAFAALLIHVGGLFVWIPSFAVHLFMTVIYPQTRAALGGMISGVVPREWAEHHHALWVRSLSDGEAEP